MKILSAEECYYDQLRRQGGKMMSHFEIAENYSKYILEKQNKNLYSEKEMDNAYDKGFKDAIEKLYSEEEVLNILNEFCDNFYENSIRKDVIEKWLEQFKKK